MPDIFVSYCREDQPVARRFAEGFEREGFTVWWDQSLSPGEAFDQVTEKALDEAKAVVVLWSKASVNSRWVRAEATQANANQRLLPVMIEPCRRPIMFELTHTADLVAWDGDPDDLEWQSFLANVRRFVERAATSSGPAPEPGAPSAALPPRPPPVARASTSPRKKREALPRRTALLYGVSAVGLAAAGFAGGALFTRRDAGTGSAPAEPPKFQRLTFRRGLIRSGRFAPDGQTILYGALWEGDQCRVHSTRTDNPESGALDLPHANLLAVSRTGELALSLGNNLEGVFTYGTLARAPMSGGAPRELAEDVDGVDRLEYPLGTVLFQPKADEGTGLGFVRVSPDGKRIAFVHYRATQSLVGRLFVIDAGGVLTRLTDEYVNIHGLAWRGTEIWYSASDDRPLFRSLLAVQPGGTPRVVARMPVNVTLWDTTPDGRLLIAQTDDRAVMIGRLPGATHDRDLSWLDASGVAGLARDGRTVLFSETGQGVGSLPSAYVRGTDGSPSVRLGNGWPLALSPDGRSALILNVDLVERGAGASIDIVPVGAGETRRLAGEGRSYREAQWLPDGERVLVRASEPGQGPRLFLFAATDGDPVALTPEGIRTWAISPDGSLIAATGTAAAIQLFPVRGGDPRVLPQTTGEEHLVGWIDEGLLMMRLRDPAAPRGEVYVLDPTTGRQRTWSNILPRDGAGIMLMNGFASTPDGRTRVFTWHRALSNLYLAAGLA